MAKWFMSTTPDEAADPAQPPSPEMFEQMGRFIEDMFRSGALVATGSMSTSQTRIQHRDGAFTVTDGPFAEAKEGIVGWAIVQAPTKEAAIELSKAFWRVAGNGTGTIQRIYDPDETPWEGAAG